MIDSLQGKHIFIIEDNKDNVYVVFALLRKHGARVQMDWWARGENHRLESAMPIDLIILDLMLPHGRTGFEVFEELRQSPILRSVPVVALSAMDPSIAMPKVRAAGFAGFISKPVDFDLFPQQIAALVAGEPVWYTA